jgi:hypothetical protein
MSVSAHAYGAYGALMNFISSAKVIYWCSSAKVIFGARPQKAFIGARPQKSFLVPVRKSHLSTSEN